MENVQIRAESFEKTVLRGRLGKKRRSARSGCICQRAAFRGQPVSVTLEPGNTGEAKEIRIEAPMRQTSIYREEQKKTAGNAR